MIPTCPIFTYICALYKDDLGTWDKYSQTVSQYFSISYKGAQKLEKPFFTLLKFAHLNFFVIGKLPLRIHNLHI